MITVAANQSASALGHVEIARPPPANRRQQLLAVFLSSCIDDPWTVLRCHPESRPRVQHEMTHRSGFNEQTSTANLGLRPTRPDDREGMRPICHGGANNFWRVPCNAPDSN